VNITETLAAIACGRVVPLDEAAARAVLVRARADRFVPLLAQGIRQAGGDAWPSSVRAELDTAVRSLAALETLQRLEIARLVNALAERGVRSMLLKGAALAYTLYADPALRPRGDIDLLVSPTDRARAADALTAIGYQPISEGGGETSFTQAHFRVTDRFGLAHTVDLHWRIANPVAFRDMVTFEELDARAEPVPSVSAHARTLGRPDALFLACVHRVAHHLDSDVLVWIYDIHLLMKTLSAQELATFEAIAIHAGASSVCAMGLAASMRYFGTPVPDATLEHLQTAAKNADEPSAAFLAPDLRLVDLLERDLAALPGWRARVRLLKEHLFPSGSYMRQAYAPGSPAPLPWLYISRIVRGAPKWLRRIPADSAPLTPAPPARRQD